MKAIIKTTLLIILMFIIASMNNIASAQTDTTTAVKPDSTKPAQPAQPAAATQQEESPAAVSTDDGRIDEFIPYVGLNISQLYISSDAIETESEMGYQLGFIYKRGGFFFWQAGARFCNSVYGLKVVNSNADFETFDVNSIDIPLSVGINILSATNRVLSLRAFISAMPSFVIGVGDNNLEIIKDDLNSFIMYGQAGIGVSVAFLVVELGYNYGFQDLIKDETSNPGQVFINLGIRF
jgi:hypothetical protein